MPLRIDKNVPIPPPVSSGKYPFKRMDIGDSFFIPLCKTRPEESLRCSIYNCAKRARMKVTMRKVTGGYRCWRIQ